MLISLIKSKITCNGHFMIIMTVIKDEPQNYKLTDLDERKLSGCL